MELDETTSDITDWINSISHAVSSKEVVLFLGAGISKASPSNLPLAGELRACILENLFQGKTLDADILLKLKGEPDKTGKITYPFEYFIQTIDRGSGKNSGFVKHLTKIYETGYPNAFHILVAMLVKLGFIDKILTTNFDTKIEQAMKAEGMTEGKDFQVFFNERHFSTIDLERLKAPTIFKIHGSVVDEESIRTTLDLICRQSLQEQRTKILRNILCCKPNILLAGYSASDEFDINPAILSTNSQSTLYWIRQPKSSETFHNLSYPFTHFDGKIVECDINVFVKKLWEDLVKGEMKINLEKTSEWRSEIQTWSKNLNPGQRSFIIAQICHNIKEFDAAEKYYREGLQIVKNAGKSWATALFLQHLGEIERLRGNYSMAKKLFLRSLKDFEKSGGIDEVSSALNQIGLIEKDLINYKEAERFFHASLEGFQRIGNRNGISQTLHNLGTIKRIQGDYDEAKRLYEQSILIGEDIGDINGVSSASHDMFEILVLQGNYTDAEKILRRQKEIASKLGDPSGIAKATHSLAIINQEQGNYVEAQKLYIFSLEIFERLQSMTDIAIAYHGLGMVKRLQYKYAEAETAYKKSLEIEEKIGDKRGKAQTLHEIGIVAQRQGKYDEAVIFLKQSLQIKKELGSPHLIAVTLAQLGLLEEDCGNKQEAARYLFQALDIFRQLNEKPYIAQAEAALQRLNSKNSSEN